MSKTTAEVQDEAAERQGSATVLAGGVTVIAAVFTLFGGLTGAVARMVRNHMILTPLFLGLTVLSVALAIMGRLALHSIKQDRGLRANTLALWTSAIFFTIGSIASVILMTISIGENDRPSVTAKLTQDAEGVVTVSGTAEVGGLNADEEVYIGIKTGDLRRYYATVGANQDGAVSHEFSVVLGKNVTEVVVTASRTKGGGQCSDDENGDGDTACVILEGG